MLEIQKVFDIEEYLNTHRKKQSMQGILDSNSRFLVLCSKIKKHIDEEWLKEQNVENTQRLLDRQKNAILGKATEVNYLKDKIREYLKVNKLESEQHPRWYRNLVDAVFHENWGIAGIAEWMDMPDSSSAKIIGNRIYFFIDGKQQLQEQKITHKRFEQLRKALLMSDERKRLNENYSEVYMETGERVTIYTDKLVIDGQPSMVFRKYIIDKLTFEEQASRNTIPAEAIPAFEALVKCGVRIAFTGPVRSGKSTLLVTWEINEKDDLEGIFLQTDPEIRMHDIKPKAPIISIIADGKQLYDLSKQIVRADGNYIVVTEVRDGYAAYIAVEAANKGTNRVKITLHLGRAEKFAYNMANKIYSVFGGNLKYLIEDVANSFDYIFEMTELPSSRNQKRLKAIYEMSFDFDTNEVVYHKICEYLPETDSWAFDYYVGKNVCKIGEFENTVALQVFNDTLLALSKKYPMKNESIVRKSYQNINEEDNGQEEG